MITKKGLVLPLAVCLSLILLSHISFSQTTTTNYTTSGTVVFGAGVTTVNVSMWGGGGGGSAGGGIEYSGTFNQVETYYTGAGGGGSNWTGGNVAVVPGTSYNFVVGTGGIAGGYDGSNNPLPGGNGGASSFLGVVSPGGYGGAAFPDSLGGPRADAPTPDPGSPYAASGENNGRVYGGDGGLSNSGAYGASGYDAQGFSGWGYNRGALGYQTGVPGLRPGDGGGGGGFTVFPIINTLAEKIAGGKGGDGRVEFRYSCNYQLTSAPLASNICGSGSSTVTLGSSSMPSGDYVVTYNTSNPSTTGNTANMTFNSATETGTFSTIALSASSIITVTNLASGTTCSNSVSSNNSVTAIVENTTIILTSALGANSYCTEDQITVPFSTGCFDFHPTANTFTAQLSDDNGSFASPTAIGTLVGSSSGTISATLPANTPAGANYRIRVVGDNPATVGSDNGADIGVRITTINTVVASASDVSICQGESIDLSVSNSSVEVADSSIILAGDFETAMNDWMFIDNSSYEYTGAVNANPDNLWINLDGNGIESNDASSYYAVNSTGRFGADVTNAVLQSPVFSTIGYNQVSLSFFHTYAWGNFNNQDSIRVQISEDNGSSWTNVYLNNSSNVGFLTAFSEQIIDLDAFANKGALMLRFNYAALGALGRWYVDNITVKGVSTPNTYEWTSSPAGFTSSVQNPTGLEPSETTIYTVTNDNNYGCSANVSTIEVVVSDTSSSSTNLSVCPSELPYSWNSLTFSGAGSQTATLTNEAGCDSLATLNLTIKSVSSSSSAESICPSDLPYSWNGLTFTEAGTQIANLTNSVGCDSAATLILTVKPNTSSITNLNICASELPYTWNGITLTNAGTQSADFTNSVGCDSTATLNLSLIPSTSVTASATLATICPSGTVDLSAVSTSGNSILIINEGFNASGNGWTTFNASTGGVPENAAWSLQPYLYSPAYAGGFEFMSNDNSQFYISSSVAQGNEVTTSTILESPSFSTEGLASASLSFFHQFKHQPGIIGNPNDSIRVQISTDGINWTNIYFNSSSSVGLSPEDFVEQIISLNGYLNEPSVKLRFEYNGTPFNTPGWTGFNLWWAIDNVVVSGVLDADTYTWSSNPAGFTSSTQSPIGLSPAVTTTYTVSTENGFCSSSDDFTVSVVAASQPSTTNLTICDSELPYTWNGLTFTEADTQTAHFTVAGACDSAATLVLAVNLGTSSTSNLTICPAGLPYSWNGLTFTEAGTQTAVLTNSLSCDSAATLILAVELSNSTSATNVTICESELPYSWNGQILNEAGNLTANFTNSLGCDSVATLNLVVNSSPENVTASTSVADVCPGETFNLSGSADNNTVTLLSEDFNSVTDFWSTTNNSTGGVFASAAWTKRPDGYELLGGAITYNSNDNSQFYHTSSFAQGAGGTTNTILQSPAFSTVGLSAASLTFYQEYGNRDANDAISVEISTDGTSWTSAYLNSSDQGSYSSFVQATVSLNGYLNQPYVMIRFVYTAANDFMWAIDNVLITGTPVAHTYSWSSDPIGFTSSTQNPTGLSLTETTTYAVTITNGRGCSDSTDVEVVFLPSSTSTSIETVCPSELPYTWNGLTFAAAGTQTATLTNALGCDSLATLELAVSSGGSSTIATICADELPYTWSGMTFNASASESLSFTDINNCDSIATLTLTVNPIPTGVLASASDSSIASGTSIDLFSTSNVPNGTIIDEGFNGVTNNWTTINEGSGGNVAGADWTLKPDGFASFHTNDNSQFYYSSSDNQGFGLTNTILQSPAFSTEGYSSVSLSFYHAFVDNNTQDSVRAQVSINNGTTWTTVYLRAVGDAGVYNSFLQTTVSLDAFLGQSNVMVRFNYRANYGYYWAIDNVSVTGTALSNDYSWLSNPVGYTSTAQNPSGISPSETTIYSVTATNTFGCIATDDVTVTSEIPCTDQWTGAVSTDWNVAGNWCSGSVPGATDDAVIVVTANQPHVTIDAPIGAFCDNLTVESGAILIVDAGKALTVNGDLSNAGTVLLKADATGIGSLITEGTVTGSGAFQMQQYLTGSNNAGTPNGLFYYVGSPVVGATAANYDVANGNKLWSANESTQSYPQITNGSTVLNQLEGYVARMGSTGVRTLSGTTFSTGNQTASGLTRTGSTAINRGYNLVGNPYPSTVSWDDAIKTNLETSMYYRTHQGSTMLYDTYNAVGSIGTNNNLGGAVTGDVPPTQAFWVRVDADGNTGQLDLDNAMRSHGTLSGIYKTEAEEGTIRMTLSNGSASDETIVLFNSAAQDNYDDFDSQKFWAVASVPQLYTTIGSDSLVINGLYSTVTNPVVDLGVKLPSAGNFSLNANQITLTGESVYLEDRVLGIFQDLNIEPEYGFNSSVGGNIPTRFALHFGMTVTGIEDEASNTRVYASDRRITILLDENLTGATVEVLDVAGRIVRTVSINESRTDMEMDVATGVYLVRVVTEKSNDTHRVFIK